MARRAAPIATICLGIYLLLQGLVLLVGLAFTGLPQLLGVLALVAGVLLLVGR
jgi:uncharacterized membrane protein HdeD (DUF308 family)